MRENLNLVSTKMELTRYSDTFERLNCSTLLERLVVYPISVKIEVKLPNRKSTANPRCSASFNCCPSALGEAIWITLTTLMGIARAGYVSGEEDAVQLG